MTRCQSIQRLWSTKIRPHLLARSHVSASARCRMDLPLEHSRRKKQYWAYPTRLRSHDEILIKEYLAESDSNSAVAGFIASVPFVHGITGYKFTDRSLLLQALYGDTAPDKPHQRLALLGDVLLQYILKDDWFQLNLPTTRVGELVQHLVTNANLADVAKETGLVKHMSFLNPKIKEGTNEHVLGTVVEALLGAIHEDSGKDMEAVRRAMHLMGLSLPKWYMAKSRLYQHESQDARAELEQYDLRKTGLKQYQRGLQKARIELNQIDLRSQPKQSDLQQAKSEMHRIVTQKQEPAKKPGRRERRRVSESLHKPQEKVDRGLSRHKNSDEESFGYRYQITEGQATSDEDLEALDGNPVRTYDLRINEESCEDYDAEHAVLEDANNQAHLRDQDADQTGLETPATHHESIETRTARFTSSSWRELMRGSDNSQRELKNAPRQKAAKPPATDFDRALRAMMLEENDGFPTEHELEGGKKWPVRHGWFPQRCQITLDVALSKDSSEEEEVADCEPNKPPTVPKLDDATLMKDPDAKEEVAACKPDSLLATSSLDDVAPSEIPETTKKVAAYEPDRMPVASTLDDVALSEPDSKEGVAFRELNRLLAPPTLDDIALPELSTMKEVAAYEPDRLRLIVAPSELDRLMTAL